MYFSPLVIAGGRTDGINRDKLDGFSLDSSDVRNLVSNGWDPGKPVWIKRTIPQGTLVRVWSAIDTNLQASILGSSHRPPPQSYRSVPFSTAATLARAHSSGDSDVRPSKPSAHCRMRSYPR